MTEKQKRFADEWLDDCNATRAYKAAYPSIKTDEAAAAGGARLLRNVKVKAYIDEQLKKLKSEKIANAEEVMEYLTSVLRGYDRDETLTVNALGEIETSKKIVQGNRLKAAELLGKRYGIFSDRVSISGAVPVVIVDDLEDDDA